MPHAVNLEQHPVCETTLIIRHRNDPGALAGILDVLRDEKIRVTGVHNTLFKGSKAAHTYLHIDAHPSPSVLEHIRRRDAVFHLDVVESQA